jgi:hypothetical protein
MEKSSVLTAVNSTSSLTSYHNFDVVNPIVFRSSVALGKYVFMLNSYMFQPTGGNLSCTVHATLLQPEEDACRLKRVAVEH